MKLLIEIPKRVYKDIKKYVKDNDVVLAAAYYIANGIEQRWIPVSEKKPKDFDTVLCWYEYYRYGEYNRMYKTYGIGFYDSVYDMWGGDIRGHKAKVLAWMPLPKPYRGGRKHEEN